MKNYYLNNGYYNVKINSSFAKLVKENEFEVIFNIDSKNKIFFGDIKLDLPADFDENNFSKLKKLFLWSLLYYVIDHMLTHISICKQW